MEDKYPNLVMLTRGCVTGRISEWPGVKAEAKIILDELTAARAEIARLRDALRQVQWGNETLDTEDLEVLYQLCPLCDQSESRGHAPDCLVSMCLEAQ